ncbi:MAG: amidohydrolase family protein [Bacteroidales bacterium]|nr:amidohydrolase family protein [Bacteroidales bacterium]MDD4656309.1 amidohydrolase family protein [Bacteroidales bacterium]
MRKIAAQYLFPLNSKKPISKGLLILSDSGEVLDIRELKEEEESTEFYNGILVPGFVNSHCHIELSHLKGVFQKGTGMAGFIRQINMLRESVSKEERIAALEREMDTLYSAGVSAMADISNCEESFETKSKSKIYTRTFLEVFGSEPEIALEVMDGVVALTALAKEYGIDAAPTPHSCYTMSPGLLEASSAKALEAGWLSYHNQESWEEEELIMSGTGPLAQSYRSRSLSMPPVTGSSALLYFLERLANIGGVNEQNVLLVHNTFTNEQSVKAAKEVIKNLYWAICPLSNLFIHNALPPLSLLMREQATITLGTDSLSSNNLLSMVDEIKCIHKYFPTIELKDILEWSSYNGAKFLGKENTLGSFEKGKEPGVVLIDNIDWQKMQLTEQSKSVRLV